MFQYQLKIENIRHFVGICLILICEYGNISAM